MADFLATAKRRCLSAKMGGSETHLMTLAFLGWLQTLRTAFYQAWTRFRYSVERRELFVEDPEMPNFKLIF